MHAYKCKADKISPVSRLEKLLEFAPGVLCKAYFTFFQTIMFTLISFHMKKLFGIALGGLLLVSAALVMPGCKKDKSFCIEDISIPTNATSGTVSFTLPNGTAYAGLGALPSTVKFGNYEGQFQSVVTKQTVVGLGQEVELVHFFDDGNGNTFWTADKALFLPLDNTGALFRLTNVMDIAGGTGDFNNASGRLVTQAEVNFITGILSGTLTGQICGDGGE